MVKYLRNITDFLFPPACPLCDMPVSVHGQLCPDCWGKFNWISDPKCIKCGYPFPANLDLGNTPLCPVCAAGKCELDWIRSACVYDNASRNAVLPFKHADKIKYAKFMAHAMIAALNDINIDADLVMPVPLARQRLFHRGYNQATLLAQPIARAFNLKMDLNSVNRKYRPDMGHKNARERAQNIHGVFSVKNKNKITGKKILLVDDVMTTGATFSELRKVLLRAGATAVYGITFCRVVRAI
ncbi:MAG: ComF family protein [Alphaproteobacteria bacterium]|nr:ComF family protein [Alphaproteobacteria bacterium]